MLKIQTQVLSLILLMIVLVIFTIWYNKKLQKQDPLKASKGIMLLMEMYIINIDNFIKNNLGKKWVKNFAPYIGGLGYLLFIGTAIGMLGITPITSSLSVTFTFGLVTFTTMQIVAVKATRWKWFKRFAEPFAVFIPVNLLAIWAPLISVSLRLFANILAGAIIVEMGYLFTNWLSSLIKLPINIFGVLVGPFFHAYFDLFAGLIQTVVFISLTVIYISQEQTGE